MTFLEWYGLAGVFVLGAVIGSFLNVVIYRLHTGKSLSGHSHCLSCQRQLRWFELFPIISYLALRGRCRYCKAHIPARYLLVELLTAVVFWLVFVTTSDLISFGLLAALMAVLIVGLVYDLYHLIIPDEIPILATVIALGFLAYVNYPNYVKEDIIWPLLAGIIAAGFFALLWLVSRGRWLGLGDAKLAFPLALLIPLPLLFSFLVLSFWTGAILAGGWFAIQLIAKYLQRRGYTVSPIAKSSAWITMKSEIPFAPFLILAFILVFFFEVDVLKLTAYAISFFSNS